MTAVALLLRATLPAWGELSFELGALWGLLSAVVVSRCAGADRRVWIQLALANLAISLFAREFSAMAAIWLPGVTAWLVRTAVAAKAEPTPAADAHNALAPQHLSIAAGEANDQHHAVDWSQTHDRMGLLRLEGTARITFRPGERQTELHLAFCPSFPGVPTFDCAQVSGPDVRLKVGSPATYGLRLEVHRSDAASWSVVGLEFTARRAEPALATLSEAA